MLAVASAEDVEGEGDFTSTREGLFFCTLTPVRLHTLNKVAHPELESNLVLGLTLPLDPRDFQASNKYAFPCNLLPLPPGAPARDRPVLHQPRRRGQPVLHHRALRARGGAGAVQPL